MHDCSFFNSNGDLRQTSLCKMERGGGNVMLSSFKTVQSSILGHASVFLDQSFTFHEKIRPW